MLDLFYQNNNKKAKFRAFEPYICKGYKGKYDIYYFDFEKGTRTKRTTRKRTQSEAYNELSRFKTNYYKGNVNEKVTYITDLIDQLLYYYSESHSKKTLEMYKTAFNRFMAVNGNLALYQISFRGIENFKLKVAHISSKTTANIYLRTLKSAFNFAKKFGYIFENPFVGVNQYKLPEHEKLSFEPEEIEIIFKMIEEPFLRRIVAFALHSGCRIGEILSLQWSNIVDLKEYIRISNKDDFLTKTRKERSIPLTSSLKQIIYSNPYSMHEINRCKQQSLQFDAANVVELDFRRNRTYVFGKPDGTKFSTGFISKSFKKYLRKAGLEEKFHFHCLRHTALTNMANKGIPAFMIKDIAGHSDIKTTAGYVHPSLNDMRNYLENLDNFDLAIAEI